RRRDPPPAARGRGGPLPGDGRVPPRHRPRQRTRRAHAAVAVAPVHPRRRDHADRAPLRAAARPLRRDLSPRPLHAGRPGAGRPPRRADPQGRDRARGRTRDRPARAGHAAHREPLAEARARLRAGPPRWKGHPPGRARGACRARGRRRRPRRRRPEAASRDHREIRWRPGRPRDAGRGLERRCRDDRRRLRAVPSPRGLRAADAARSRRDGARVPAAGPGRAAERHAVERRRVKRFELERAITDNELLLHYQPIVAVPSRKLTGVEAPSRALARDPAPPVGTLELMRDRGIRVTLDDATEEDAHILESFPADIVKVSRGLITRMGRDHRALEYVRAVLRAARERGLEATAVGVEDEATWGRLSELGFSGAQGYLIAAPMPPAQLAEWRSARQ